MDNYKHIFKKGVVDTLVIVVVLVIAVAATGFYIVNFNNNQKITSDPNISFSLEDISQHNTEEDCWMAVDGAVYDVTEYVASGEHPAGKAILKGCGLEASEMFAGPHSEKAYAMLPEYRIGTLLLPEYTLEQISEHDNAEDCWMAIDGKVYDVTEYIASEEHPAGKAILKGCGLEASDMFAGPHSEAAYEMLPQHQIGVFTE